MLRASVQTPILLDGLAQAPAKVRTTILNLLQRAPLTTFIQLEEGRERSAPTSRLDEIFAPTALQSVMAN